LTGLEPTIVHSEALALTIASQHWKAMHI
jgi:hypothetical protein